MRRTRQPFPALLATTVAVLAVLAAVAMPAAAQATAQATAPGDDPVPLARTGRITDRVDALQGRTAQVTAAQNRLYDRHRVQLFAVYVNGFSGRTPQDWANATAVRNGLGRGDILLAVATHDRRYAVSADQDARLTQSQIDQVGGEAIEPALRENDWAGAVIGAANGYDAVLSGRPVIPPTITPGAADPGSARDDVTTGAVWVPVAALAAVALLTLYAIHRRRARMRPVRTSAGHGATEWRGRPKQPVPVTPLPELDSQARELLVATDDAVRTSQEDLGFAAAQLGEEAAGPFGEAVGYARGELSAAFRLRQRLDDAPPEDDGTRRQMLDEILSRCTQANRRLDAESEGFDRLRAMEANAAQVLARAEAAADALPDRITAAEAALGPLAERYAGSALEPVTGHPAEAADRLAFARTSLEQARAALGTDHGRTAVFVRAAEGALGQAEVLAGSVLRREHELRAAETVLREALAETEADLAEAGGLLGADGSGNGNGAAHAELRGRAARAEAVLAAVRDEAAAGRPDPIAALRRVEEADTALDGALAAARERESGAGRAGALLEQALLAARSEVAAARDTVTTHRGAIGSHARTRLAEAERLLRQAESRAAGPGREALTPARDADRLAREARALAARDVDGFSPAPSHAYGGALLGGILLATGPAAFGGPRTRARLTPHPF